MVVISVNFLFLLYSNYLKNNEKSVEAIIGKESIGEAVIESTLKILQIELKFFFFVLVFRQVIP